MANEIKTEDIIKINVVIETKDGNRYLFAPKKDVDPGSIQLMKLLVFNKEMFPDFVLIKTS